MHIRTIVSIRLIKTRENGFELNEDRKVVYRRRPPQQILLHFSTQLEGLSHNDTYDIDQVKASWHLASHLARKAGRDGLIVSVKPVLFHVRAGSCRELASQALLALVWGCHWAKLLVVISRAISKFSLLMILILAPVDVWQQIKSLILNNWEDSSRLRLESRFGDLNLFA